MIKEKNKEVILKMRKVNQNLKKWKLNNKKIMEKQKKKNLEKKLKKKLKRMEKTKRRKIV